MHFRYFNKGTTKFLKHHFLVIFFIVFMFAANIIWIIKDTSPPLWDIAGHSERAVLVSDFLAGFHFKSILLFKTIYPPFAYLVAAIFFLLAGYYADIPQYSLLLFLAVYIVSVYVITLHFYKSRLIALVASVLATISPLLSHFTRIYDLDFPLAALTIAAVAVLLKTNYFQHRFFSLLFGVVAAFACLTKWTATVFILAPFIFILLSLVKDKKINKERMKNLFYAGLIFCLLTLPWYIIHSKDIIQSASATRRNIFSVPAENLLSLDNITFYISWINRGITLPLFLLFLLGLVIAFKRRNGGDKFLVWSFIMPYGIMTFFIFSKESRYLLPIFPWIAIITAAFLKDIPFNRLRIVFASAILFIAVFFWIETSSGLRFLPQNSYSVLGLTKAYGYLHPSTGKVYFGFPYPTAYHQQVPFIIETIAEDLKRYSFQEKYLHLAVVPNSLFLTAQQIKYYGRLTRFDRVDGPFQIDYSLSSRVREKNWREEIIKAHYLITKTGDQGPSVWGKYLKEIAEAEEKSDSIFRDNFALIKTWPLNGIEIEEQTARLYRNKNFLD